MLQSRLTEVRAAAASEAVQGWIFAPDAMEGVNCAVGGRIWQQCGRAGSRKRFLEVGKLLRRVLVV